PDAWLHLPAAGEPAEWREGSDRIPLVLPPDGDDLRTLLALRDAGPVIRVAGRFTLWDGDRRLRYLLAETSGDRTHVSIADARLSDGVTELCLHAVGQRVRAGVQGLRVPLTIVDDCRPVAPVIDCATPLPRLDEGPLVHVPPSAGLVDPVMNDETYAQERSWLHPAMALALMRAARTTACVGAEEGWPGTGFPLVIGDASLADGATPRWEGHLAHPAGSHVDGWDVDVSYPQLGFAPDNDMRAICRHGTDADDQRYCLDAPVTLDVRRAALLTGLLAEDPRVRCVGVDGRVGPLLVEARAALREAGRLAARPDDKLCFETEDTGRGWLRGHHDHLHVAGARPPAGEGRPSPSWHRPD
ncbi:MAG: hypothetical protein AAF211_28940, partial [Myxococcota bacterium]